MFWCALFLHAFYLVYHPFDWSKKHELNLMKPAKIQAVFSKLPQKLFWQCAGRLRTVGVEVDKEGQSIWSAVGNWSLTAVIPSSIKPLIRDSKAENNSIKAKKYRKLPLYELRAFIMITIILHQEFEWQNASLVDFERGRKRERERRGWSHTRGYCIEITKKIGDSSQSHFENEWPNQKNGINKINFRWWVKTKRLLAGKSLNGWPPPQS